MDESHVDVFGILVNPTKENIVASSVPVLEYLQNRRQPFVIESHLAEMLRAHGHPADRYVKASREGVASKSSILITYGGDGTLLAVAQYSLQYDVPVLGVNLGKLGFLADIRPDEVIGAIERILDDHYIVEKRTTLQGRVENVTGTFYGLNDIVVSKSGTTKVIEIEAYINDEYLATFFADGFIISTPTGSTAYSLATGGPIVVPGGDVMILSPISAHTLTARPMIIPCSSKITLHATATDGVAMVMTDGQLQAENLSSLTMHVEKSQKNVKLVKGIGPSYFTTLRQKLHWATDTRKSTTRQSND